MSNESVNPVELILSSEDAKFMDIHRGKIFTPTADPFRSYDLPYFSDCYHGYDDGALIVDRKSGVFLAVGAWDKIFPQNRKKKNINGWDFNDCKEKGCRFKDHRPLWILPGFIDGHTHLSQYPVAGRGGVVLQDWLKRTIYPAEARFTEETFAKKTAQHFFDRLVRVGTTTAVVMTTIHKKATHLAFEEAFHSGLRIFMGKMMMDMNAPSSLLEDYKSSIKESNELCDLWHGKDDGRIQYVYSPRFALTCSRELLKATGQEAKSRKVAIHTHINETRAEVASAKQIHPWAKHYTDIYLKCGLIHEDHLNILAHQIYPSIEELADLKGMPVCTVHCPSANYALRSGEFDLLKIYHQGLDRIALGTDVGAGSQLSLLDAMRSASFIRQNDLPIYHLYYLATLGGARALGLNAGSLEQGREADFIVLDPEIANPNPSEPLASLEEMLLVLMSRGHETMPLVQETYVRGKQVFDIRKENYALSG